MTTCERCGLEVVPDYENRRFVGTNGSTFCAQSLPGEASVHRVAEVGVKPPMTREQRRKARRREALGVAAKGVGGWYLGVATGALFNRILNNQHDGEALIASVHDVFNPDN